MELPQPPSEQELKNIIDKLAQFVARNGPEFEQMTKQKQKDNPKFSFLFGGEFFNYYQYRVTTEQAILKQKQRTVEQQQAIVQHVVNQQSIQSAPWQQQQLPPPPPPQQSVADMHEQIRQSEQNLAAQHQLLLQQQQVQVDEAIRKAQDDKMSAMARDCSLNLDELESFLLPIIENCKKDSISNGKGWIFSNATTGQSSEVTALYIQKKVTAPGTTFEAKLHLVYLINDVLHHCARKNTEDLKKTLDRVVVPIFCSTSIAADPDQQQKLLKLFKLWETNKYFSQQMLEQLQNPVSSLAAYQASLIAEYANVVGPITSSIQNQYAALQKQHQDFVAHLTNQMHHLQSPQNPLMTVHPAVSTPYPLMQQQTHPPNVQQPPHVSLAQQQSHAPVVQQLQSTDSQSQQPQQQQQILQQPIQQMPPQSVPQQQIPQQSMHQQIAQQPQQQIQNMSPALSEVSSQLVTSQQQIQVSKSGEEQNSPFIQTQTHVPEDQAPITSTPDNVPLPPTSCSSDRDLPPPQPPCNFDTTDVPLPGPSYGNLPDDRAPLLPTRAPNGQPHQSRFSEDFSPRYVQPPHMGYMDMPEYGLTPPHLGSYNTPPPHFGPPPPRGMPMSINQHDGLPHHPLPPEFMEHMMPPTPPYYDLPAGLMVPLVKLEDTDYNMPLDPADIRLPAPALPTDRLLAAVELFYSPPSHDRARNSEGWEQLGLYEYFKAKSQAKKQKQGQGENADSSGDESQEASNFSSGGNIGSGLEGIEQHPLHNLDEKQPSRRRYREFKSPEKTAEPPQPARNEGQSKSHSRSRSRSKSRSPSSSSRHRSPPYRPHNRRSPRSRSPSPSRKRSPERSPTPPSFFGGSYPGAPLDRRLDESNKGHQLLKKMGWSGAGLGATEQGIQDPVDAGEVRDRQDLYKGIGINLNDPYENFRKSKGQAFINRMKARAEELGKI